MKKAILLTTVFLSCLFLKGQVVINFEAGASQKGTPMAGVNAGFQKGVSFSAGYLTHLSSKVKDGAVFQFKVGHVFAVGETGTQIEPSAGYSQTIRSSDKTYLNSKSFIGSVNVSRPFGIGRWFVGITGWGGNPALTGGLRYIF